MGITHQVKLAPPVSPQSTIFIAISMLIIEKKDFQDLNNAGIMKANLLKKITSSALVTMSIEEKRNLGLKSIVGEVKIEPFK